MIVAAEGPSAAGKTTWVTAHHERVAVWEYRPVGAEPDRATEPEHAARFWADVNAKRWQEALDTESAHGMAACDTDPFKLHYVWSLWRLGEASTSAWRYEAEVNRGKFKAGLLGFADLILCDIPDAGVLHQRRETDGTRTRRNFHLHARLSESLREWYSTIDALDPGRVRWVLPSDGAIPSPPRPRARRSDSELLDEFLGSLPHQ